MTRDQRYKYEMLVRVREFGFTHRDRFPAASVGGAGFARVEAALAAIDDHLRDRCGGQAASRKVKRSTRAAVRDYMKVLTKAGRRAARRWGGTNVFHMPPRRTQTAELATARAFIVEATKVQERFIELGLPLTFLSDFTALVDGLQEAMDIRVGSKTVRGQAQAGLIAELARGFDAVLDLDVHIAAIGRKDPLMGLTWRSVRRIEGRRRRRVRRQGAVTRRSAPRVSPPRGDGRRRPQD